MIPFMKLKWVSLLFSFCAISGIYYVTLEVKDGFKKGIDFAGGIKLEIKQNDKVSIPTLRKFFKNEKIDAIVQLSGKENSDIIKIEIGSQDDQVIEIKAIKISEELLEAGFSKNSVDYIKYKMIKALSKKKPELIEFVNTSKIGPTIGKFLTDSAIKLLLITLGLITVYVAFRFRLNYALGAMFALVHDLLFVAGLIGILQIPLSIPVVAALLTILGYSINDTIVVYDRIRENSSGHNEQIGFGKIVDRSIYESLSRTIVTSLTTLVSIVSVYFLGGEGLNDMAEVLILGIIVGTYSSIFIASPIVVIGNKFLSRT